MKSLKACILFAIALLSYSCSDAIYENHQDVKEVLAWAKTDVKEYQVNIPDEAAYHVVVALRHHSKIPGSGIPLEVTMKGPNGESETKAVDFKLRDANGDLVGSAAGDICDTEMTIMENHKFSPAGNYTFTVAHTVSNEETGDRVAGMIEVGLRVTPVAKK